MQEAAMLTHLQKDTAGAGHHPVSPHGAAPARRLRILHIVPRLGMGGTENGVLKVARGLGEQDFEHRICAVRGIDKEFAAHITGFSKVYSAGNSNPGFQFPLFRLARIMKEFRPHIVHTRNFGALEGILSAQLARVPIAIHSEHGYELEILGGLPLRRRILCRALYGMADAVFTVTADLCAYHARQSWRAAHKFRVIYNGVDTDRFAPDPVSAREIRAEFGIPAGRTVVGSVGRLVPIKDHGTLLRAVEVLLRQGRDVHVLLVGSGPEQPRLEAQVAASAELRGRVKFAGTCHRVPELLNAMDVFVLPSICEGMSNTILEAMACALPVLVTRTGGNVELTGDGCLFAPRDYQTLAELLARVIGDSRRRTELGQAARQRAIEQFSLAGMVQAYRDLYVEFAAKLDSAKLN